jgi:recombination protein RecA
VKNKVAPPFKQTEFQIMYGQGINRLGEVIDFGVKLGLVDKAGAWYSYQGTKIGQGKNNVVKYLQENPDIAFTIEQQIRAELLPESKTETETADAEETAEA